MAESESSILTIEIFVDDNRWTKKVPNAEKLCFAAFSETEKYLKLSKRVDVITLILSNDELLQKLNNQFRQKNVPTNVLSFPAMNFGSSDQFNALGEIYLSYDTILKEAKHENKTFEDHLQHLVIHGFLHLLGYDHIEDEEAKEMEQIEIDVLERLGISNPYFEEPKAENAEKR